MNLLLSVSLLMSVLQVLVTPDTHRRLIDEWLRAHPQYRIAQETDCDCAEDIQAVRHGYGGIWKGNPQYNPYYTVGDFNGDGKTDFAVALVDRRAAVKLFVILVFNGPLASRGQQMPAFVSEAIDLKYSGMFFGPPRPRPYRLVVGRFESEGRLLVPAGPTYRWR